MHFFAQLSLSAFFKFTPSRQTNFSFLFLLELLNIDCNDWKLQTDTSVYNYVDKKIFCSLSPTVNHHPHHVPRIAASLAHHLYLQQG